MSENFPAEKEQRRKPLYPVLSDAKKMNKRANINYDQIFTDGINYNAKDRHKLPDELKPEKIAMPTANGITAFF